MNQHQNKIQDFMNPQQVEARQLDINIEQAKEYFYAEQFLEALKLLEQGISSISDNRKDKYYELMGCIQFFRGSFCEAERYFDMAIDQNKNNVDYYISRAACQIEFANQQVIKNQLKDLSNIVNFPSIYYNLQRIGSMSTSQKQSYKQKQRKYRKYNENFEKYRGLQPTFIKNVQTDEVILRDQNFKYSISKDTNYQNTKSFFDFLQSVQNYISQRQKIIEDTGILYDNDFGCFIMFFSQIYSTANKILNIFERQISIIDENHKQTIIPLISLAKDCAQDIKSISQQEFQHRITQINNSVQNLMRKQIKFIHVAEPDSILKKYIKNKGNEPQQVIKSQSLNEVRQSLNNRKLESLNNKQQKPKQIRVSEKQQGIGQFNVKYKQDEYRTELQKVSPTQFEDQYLNGKIKIAQNSQKKKFICISPKFKKDIYPQQLRQILSNCNPNARYIHFNLYWLICIRLFVGSDSEKAQINEQRLKRIQNFFVYFYKQLLVGQNFSDIMELTKRAFQKEKHLFSQKLLQQNRKKNITNNLNELLQNFEQILESYTDYFKHSQHLKFFTSPPNQSENQIFRNHFSLNPSKIDDLTIQAYLILIFHLKDKCKGHQIISHTLSQIMTETKQTFNGRKSMMKHFKDYKEPPSLWEKVSKFINN